jgi:hypothetical protein
MRELPWNGLTPWGRRSLLAALRRSEGNEGCPEITRGEAATILGASERLAVTRDLEGSVEAMVGWVSRAIVRHELRHVADDPSPPVCRGCPPELGEAEVSELHAYLASFADEETGAVALLQACNLGQHNGGAHEVAFAWVSRRLMLDGCLMGPPPDLAERSRSLLRHLFGDDTPLDLSANFPRSVRFLPRDHHDLVGSTEHP